jgi:hypothetical protein
MNKEYNVKAMVTKIEALRQNAEALKEIVGDFPSVVKNCDRILANVRMLEININDAADILVK